MLLTSPACPRSAAPRRHLRSRALAALASADAAPSLVWLTRTSLRLDDHPALLAAQRAGGQLAFVYVHERSDDAAAASAALALRFRLRALGAELIVRSGSPALVLPELAAQLGARSVFVAAEPETLAAEAVAAARDALASSGCQLHSCRTEMWASCVGERAFASNWRSFQRSCGALLPAEPHGLTSAAFASIAAAPIDSAAEGELLRLASSPPRLSTELEAQAALRTYLSPAGREMAAASESARPGCSFAVLFETPLSLGLLSPRAVAAAAGEVLKSELASTVKDSSRAARARAAKEGAERAAFHTRLALEDGARRAGSDQPARGNELRQKWWRWKGALMPYIHVPSKSRRSDSGGDSAAPKRALVLVHGFGAFGEHWRRNWAAGGGEEDVWAPTLPGFGRSEKAALPYTQTLWTEYLAAFLTDVVGPGVPCAVAGNSIGGFIVSNLAADYPHLVSQLVLVNTAGPITPNPPLSPPRPARPPPAFLVDFGVSLLLWWLERNIPSTLARCYPISPENADPWLAQEIGRAAADSGAAFVFASVAYLPPPRPLNVLVSAFGGPTLALAGVKDPLNDAGGRASLLGELCGPELVEVALLEGGHCPHDEVPALVNARLRAFLDETAAAGGKDGDAGGSWPSFI